MKRFNWFVLLALVMIFATGGTMALIGSVILSGHVVLWAVSMFLGLGLYAASFYSLRLMEGC